MTDRPVTVSAIVACLLKTFFFLTAVCQAQRERNREKVVNLFLFIPVGDALPRGAVVVECYRAVVVIKTGTKQKQTKEKYMMPNGSFHHCVLET